MLTVPRTTFLLFFAALVVLRGETLEYSVTDPALKVARIDTSTSEAFLAVRADAAGRIWVGGREALFVYEPETSGVYKPRREVFRFPKHSWIYDIEIRGNDVFVSTNAAVYAIPNGVVRTDGLVAKRLVWGIPLGYTHQCFHGLTWGPDGDLYLSTGDPMPLFHDLERPDNWAYWTFFYEPPGSRLPFHGQGGVYRFRPDGTDFRVVARGTRNSIGLAFDSDWNLFTNDNDHEAVPLDYVPGRLLHVTPHAYFSWPRGWMPQKQPQRRDLLDVVFAEMGRAVPIGTAYYNETHLPKKYRNNLLVARWGTRTLTRYPLTPHGSSFRAPEHPLLVGRDLARPVGVCVGRGGRIFVTICYMAHNDQSPAYRSDLAMISRADDPSGAPFESYTTTKVDAPRLWSELESPSWSRRYRAFVEIQRRGGDLLDEATRRLAAVTPGDPTASCLVWLAAASKSGQACESLARLATGGDAGLRHQAIRALAEFLTDATPRKLFVHALADSDPRVRLAATTAFFEDAGPVPPEIVRHSARSDDRRIRQAATFLLAEKLTVDELRRLCDSDDPKVRTASVLAAGYRLTMPKIGAVLADDLPLREYGPVIGGPYVIEYAGETIDLRTLGRVGMYRFEEHWNRRPHTDVEESLFRLLLHKLDDPEEPIRLDAARNLSYLRDPRSEPAVTKVWTASEETRLSNAPTSSISQLWLAGPFPDGGKGFGRSHPPQESAIDLAARYPVGDTSIEWRKVERHVRLFDFVKEYGSFEDASVYAYVRLESATRQRILFLPGSDDGIQIWLNGALVWTNDVERGALPIQDRVKVELQPGGNDILMRVHNVAGLSALYVHYRAAGKVIARLPEKLEGTLAARLKNSGGDVPPEFLKVNWAEALMKGDKEKGKQLYAATCGKCHAVSPDAPVIGGPSLAAARKRFTVPYLVESVLFPSRQLSPIFEGTLVVTKEGDTLTGLVVGETGDALELLLLDATRKKIAKDAIADRQPSKVSPMPQGLVKTPGELRDVLAYLLGE